MAIPVSCVERHARISRAVWIYSDAQLLRNSAGRSLPGLTRRGMRKVWGLVGSAAGMPEGNGGPQLPELSPWVSPAPRGAPQET